MPVETTSPCTFLCHPSIYLMYFVFIFYTCTRLHFVLNKPSHKWQICFADRQDVDVASMLFMLMNDMYMNYGTSMRRWSWSLCQGTYWMFRLVHKVPEYIKHWFRDLVITTGYWENRCRSGTPCEINMSSPTDSNRSFGS